MKLLGPKRTELIQIADEEIEELEKALEEDTRIANDQNEQPSVRERAREKLQKIPKGKTFKKKALNHSRKGRFSTSCSLSLNRKENSLWRSDPFGSD